MATTKQKSASASATTGEQKKLSDGKYYVTISNDLRKCTVEDKTGVHAGTITNTKPTTHIKWTDNNGNRYDVLVPTNVMIDGVAVTTKFLTQKDFGQFLEKYAKKSFLVDKTISPHAKKKKLDLHSIPEFSETMKKIDELQKQIDELTQSIKSSDTYRQLTQTEKQKQAQVNLIDKVKMLIASGALKITDLQ